MIYYVNSEDMFLQLLNNIKEYDIIYLTKNEYVFNKTINISKSNIIISTQNNISVIFNFKNIPYVCDNYNSKKTKEYIKKGNGINVYGDNIILENIIIKFAAFRGLENFGNNNKFINIETSYNCDTGHSQKGCNNIIKNCVSHHNFDYRLIKNYVLSFGFNSDGFSDKFHNGHGNTYINCLSYENGDDGYTFFQRDTSEEFPTIMKNCKAINNSLHVINLSENERFLEDDNKFKNMYNIDLYPNYGNGHGFKLGGVHKSVKNTYINKHYIKLYNCESLSNKLSGFTNNHNEATIYLENCVSKDNFGKNYGFYGNVSLYLINCKSSPKTNICISDTVKIIEKYNNNFIK